MTRALAERQGVLLDAVNSATTQRAHNEALVYLYAWRDGVADALGWDDAARGRMIIAGDWHYLEPRGPVDGLHPMCGGVWLDWAPAAASVANEVSHG